MADENVKNAANANPGSELPEENTNVNPLNKLTEEDWKRAMAKGQQDAQNQSASIRARIDLGKKRAGAPAHIRAVLDRVDSHTSSVARLWDLTWGHAEAEALRGRLQLIKHWLEDLESTFLEPFWLQPGEPGSPGEVWALDQAEMYLQYAIVPQIEAVQEIIAGRGSEASLR